MHTVLDSTASGPMSIMWLKSSTDSAWVDGRYEASSCSLTTSTHLTPRGHDHTTEHGIRSEMQKSQPGVASHHLT